MLWSRFKRVLASGEGGFLIKDTRSYKGKDRKGDVVIHEAEGNRDRLIQGLDFCLHAYKESIGKVSNSVGAGTQSI